MRSDHVLVVDDERLIRWSIAQSLANERYAVSEASTLAEARAIISTQCPDLIVLDQTLPDGVGLDLLQELRSRQDSTAVIMLTADEQSQTAVRAMKLDAFDYLNKPVDLAHLLLVIGKALEMTLIKRQLARLRVEREGTGQGELIGASPAMRNVFDFIRRVALNADTTVLITGDSGTGKELVARAIHNLSARAASPMITVNCAGMQDSFIDSDLFGHERGAFTDARDKKRGLAEIAEGGTLFLDEIGDISPTLQMKLLRVVEQKNFRRLGGTADIALNARIITATNRNLRSAVTDGGFRADLFFRLNVATVHVPPLRDRQEDVLLLAQHFLQQYNITYNKQFKGLTAETRELFLRYHWPGNVRELKHVVERAVLLDDGDMIFSHAVHLGHLHELPAPPSAEATGPLGTGAGKSLDDMEREAIVAALNTASNNQSKAARILGISRDTLRYRLKKHGLGTANP